MNARASAERLPFWPAGLTRSDALAYSNLAPSLLDRIVSFKAVGPRGALVCSRAKLDEALQRVLDGSTDLDLDDEFAGVGRG